MKVMILSCRYVLQKPALHLYCRWQCKLRQPRSRSASIHHDDKQYHARCHRRGCTITFLDWPAKIGIDDPSFDTCAGTQGCMAAAFQTVPAVSHCVSAGVAQRL